MIDLLLGLLPLVIVYALVGIVVTILAGGRDPLDFAPPWVVVAWPVVVIVAGVGRFAMWAARDGDAQ